MLGQVLYNCCFTTDVTMTSQQKRFSLRRAKLFFSPTLSPHRTVENQQFSSTLVVRRKKMATCQMKYWIMNNTARQRNGNKRFSFGYTLDRSLQKESNVYFITFCFFSAAKPSNYSLKYFRGIYRTDQPVCRRLLDPLLQQERSARCRARTYFMLIIASMYVDYLQPAFSLRACLRGGGGPQIGDVTCRGQNSHSFCHKW